jgi:hypothetical protein
MALEIEPGIQGMNLTILRKSWIGCFWHETANALHVLFDLINDLEIFIWIE